MIGLVVQFYLSCQSCQEVEIQQCCDSTLVEFLWLLDELEAGVCPDEVQIPLGPTQLANPAAFSQFLVQLQLLQLQSCPGSQGSSGYLKWKPYMMGMSQNSVGSSLDQFAACSAEGVVPDEKALRALLSVVNFGFAVVKLELWNLPHPPLVQ